MCKLKQLIPTSIMLIKRGSEKHKKVVGPCRTEMSPQQDHDCLRTILKMRISMRILCPWIKRMTTRWSSKKLRRGLSNSGLQINKSPIKVRPMPPVKTNCLKTLYAEFVSALNKKVLQMKMVSPTSSFAPVNVLVPWVWSISPVFANGSTANAWFTKAPKSNHFSGNP